MSQAPHRSAEASDFPQASSPQQVPTRRDSHYYLAYRRRHGCDARLLERWQGIHQLVFDTRSKAPFHDFLSKRHKHLHDEPRVNRRVYREVNMFYDHLINLTNSARLEIIRQLPTKTRRLNATSSCIRIHLINTTQSEKIMRWPRFISHKIHLVPITLHVIDRLWHLRNTWTSQRAPLTRQTANEILRIVVIAIIPLRYVIHRRWRVKNILHSRDRIESSTTNPGLHQRLRSEVHV